MRFPINGVSFLLASMLLAPSPARAHAHLVRSAPAEGSRVNSSPASIRLWFSERPDLSLTLADLKGPDGISIATGKASRIQDDKLGVEFQLRSALSPGQYSISWRAAAADGHPTHGEFSFEVLSPARTTAKPIVSIPDSSALSSSKASPPATDDDHAASIPNSIARALLFIGLIVLIGSVTFALAVLPNANNVDAASKATMLALASRSGLVAAILVSAAALMRLNLESTMMKAMPDMPGMAGTTIEGMVVYTTWGMAFMLQLASAIVAIVAFLRAGRGVTWAWYLALICALTLALTPALSGHAGATPNYTGIVIASDWLHVLAGGAWLGTLFCVMVIGVPVACKHQGDDRWTSISSLVATFSRIAMISVATIVVSGVFASWMHLGSLSDLWTTTYGKTLSVKIALALLAVGAGAYNFKRVQPQLDSEKGTRLLRRSATLELAIGLLILIVSGFLTGLSS